MAEMAINLLVYAAIAVLILIVISFFFGREFGSASKAVQNESANVLKNIDCVRYPPDKVLACTKCLQISDDKKKKECVDGLK